MSPRPPEYDEAIRLGVAQRGAPRRRDYDPAPQEAAASPVSSSPPNPIDTLAALRARRHRLGDP